MQLTELWTQCFVWWEVEERAGGKLIAHVGVCTDRRLGFGGAFAPNRFERVSLLVAALTQRMQAAFDLQQPPHLLGDLLGPQHAQGGRRAK